MTVNEYQELALRTVNPELSKRDMLINSVMGLCGESGEAIDLVKKWFAHGRELDRDHFIKELGDIAWYLAEAAAAVDITLDEVLARNIEKLRNRYPEVNQKKAKLERSKLSMEKKQSSSIHMRIIQLEIYLN